MAVYKIFPEKDATIYSAYPYTNTGRDEILELSTIPDILQGSGGPQTSRILIKFPTSEILDVIQNKVLTSPFSATLKLFLANASNIPLDYSIKCYPLSQSWNMGTGKYGDSPITSDGVSWKYLDYSGSNQWTLSSNNATSSYITGNEGGGIWITGSGNFDFEETQTFNYITSKDIEISVYNFIDALSSSSIENNGLIIKREDSLEFNSSSYFELKYFSMDTHTIYPPHLEISWDDFLFNTGSISGSFINSEEITVTLSNNKNEFNQNSIQKFRVNVRDKYPARVFTTSSIYLNNKYLPLDSYYQVRDLDTNEIIIDFNDYTKISADSTSNYFILYMNGLEPQRYYKILIKTTINENTLIIDNNYYFKITY